MLSQLKTRFILPWIMLCALAAVHSLVQIVFFAPAALAWYGSLLSCVAIVSFFAWVTFAHAGRTSRYMPLQWLAFGLAVILLSLDFNTNAAIYIVGFSGVGLALYVFWFSSLQRDPNGPLAVGKVLPEFTIPTSGAGSLNSKDLLGRHSLFIFYRGNWCPLCVAQIEEVAELYQQLSTTGVDIFLVSPQSSSDTEQLAKKFAVPMTFCIDQNLALTRQLDLLHEGGKPAGTPGGSEDTVMPTVLIADGDNRVIWSDQTDNYRVRPEPDVFINVLQQYHTANTAG